MRILTRYILRELLGPTLIGFAFYTFILLMQTLFRLAEMIIRRSLPFETVIELLSLSLPNIVVLTIPMSLLFGILIAVGRLSADSEIIAMRSAGLPTGVIYRPVLYFSILLFGLNFYLMNVVVPRGNAAFVQLRNQVFASSAEREIKPRVFYDEYANRVIYIDDVRSADGLWQGVFVSDTTNPESPTLVTAEAGRLQLQQPGNQLWLNLKSSETHISNASKPDRYDLNRNATQRILILDRFSDQQKRSFSRDLKEMTFQELRAESKRTINPADYRLTRVEMHKKFSIPFACIAFGVIGLPLGITNRRGGKSSGFSLSILIILIYYVLINNGEDLARDGRLPAWLAMWLPNIALIAVGIFLVRRANRDAGSTERRGIAGFLARLIPRRRRGAGAIRSESTGEPSILSRLDIPFPNTIDRYILRGFIGILGLVLLSTAVLFLIIEYTELATDISENKVAAPVVASYFRYYLIQILDWVLPISILLTTLVTFGVFSKNNEVTAMKANGISLYRISLPVLVMAGAVSVVAYLLLDFVLPYSNQKLAFLRNVIKGKETAQTFNAEQKRWIFGKGRYLFNFLKYDEATRTLSDVQVVELAPNGFRIRRRISADEARFDGTGWIFYGGWMRTFAEDGSHVFFEIREPVRMPYPERPEYFKLEVKSPGQMTYRELRSYISDLRRSGYESEELLVELYRKTSWPFLSLVMAIIALPFSFRMGKQGALYGVGIALGLAFIYYMAFGIFTKLGEAGNLPAILAAWSANVLFVLAAVYMFLRVET